MRQTGIAVFAGAVVLVVASLFSITGCGPSEQQKLITYFNAIAQHEKDVEGIVSQLEKLGDEYNKEKPDFAGMKTKVDDLKAQVEEKKKAVEAVPAPESGKSLHELVLGQYDVVIKTIEKSGEMVQETGKLLPFLEKIKKAKPSEIAGIMKEAKSVQAKVETMKKEVEKLGEEGDSYETRIKEEQQRLAKQYNITLK